MLHGIVQVYHEYMYAWILCPYGMLTDLRKALKNQVNCV